MTTDLRTLLLLDDDEVFATRMARALGMRGFEVTRGGHGRRGPGQRPR